jgi:hypothetical protein
MHEDNKENSNILASKSYKIAIFSVFLCIGVSIALSFIYTNNFFLIIGGFGVSLFISYILAKTGKMPSSLNSLIYCNLFLYLILVALLLFIPKGEFAGVIFTFLLIIIAIFTVIQIAAAIFAIFNRDTRKIGITAIITAIIPPAFVSILIIGMVGAAWGRPLRIKGRQLHPELRIGSDWTRG